MNEISCFCGGTTGRLVRKRIRGGKKRKIFKCIECGTVQKGIQNATDHEEFHRESGQSSEINLDPMSESYRQRNRIDIDRRKELLDPILNEDQLLLDFGTGIGGFLKAVDDKVEKAIGCEINESQAEFVRRELGFEVYQDLESAGSVIDRDSIDVITMFHVLEHLVDPVEYLNDCREILDNDGYLIVEVPNHDDWLLEFSEDYSDFYYQDAHSYYFDPESLQNVLERSGYCTEITGVQRYSYKNAVNWLLKGEPELDQPSRHDPEDSVFSRIYHEMVTRLLRSDTLFAFCRPKR